MDCKFLLNLLGEIFTLTATILMLVELFYLSALDRLSKKVGCIPNTKMNL